jgi:hypothetical protein
MSAIVLATHHIGGCARRMVVSFLCSLFPIPAAGARDRDKALQIALDVEPLLHEADVLLTTATIIRRQSQASP